VQLQGVVAERSGEAFDFGSRKCSPRYGQYDVCLYLLHRASDQIFRDPGARLGTGRWWPILAYVGDPTLPLFDVIPMAAVVSASVARTTFTGWMLGAAAVIALVLGVIGVYGVIAYTVGTRTREIGLRLALGAPPGGVRWLVVRQGFAVVGAGMAAGLVLTVLLTGSLTTLLFGVSRLDPMTLLAVTVTLGVAALAASWIPAARAGRVDPAVTLASE
jgi:hypothetical protein